mmetsp:Transcript_5527/g.16498  ORF Transcript_5527/g.16498 Transcript_5527/m.16498 type:complete len:409 (+) Transcript_5527:94-1320(+)
MEVRKDMRWFSVGFACGTVLLVAYLLSEVHTVSLMMHTEVPTRADEVKAGEGLFKRLMTKGASAEPLTGKSPGSAPAKTRERTSGSFVGGSRTKMLPNKDVPLADSDPPSVLSTRIPECAKQYNSRAESAFMLMISHSGSTALITQLAAHKDVGNFTAWHNLEPLAKFDANFAEEEIRVDECYDKAKEAGKMGLLKYDGRSVLGFASKWKELLGRHNSRIMFMHRANLFKRAIGRYPYYYLNYQGHFGGLRKGEKRDCDKTNTCTFEVDPYNVHCEMKRAYYIDEALHRRLDSILGEDKCALEILYEDYLYHPTETMHQIEDFLGLKHQDHIHSERVKSTSDSICNAISNYADVCAAFNECTRWSWMINDERNGCLCSNYEYTSLGGDDTNPLCSLDRMPGERRWCQG